MSKSLGAPVRRLLSGPNPTPHAGPCTERHFGTAVTFPPPLPRAFSPKDVARWHQVPRTESRTSRWTLQSVRPSMMIPTPLPSALCLELFLTLIRSLIYQNAPVSFYHCVDNSRPLLDRSGAFKGNAVSLAALSHASVGPKTDRPYLRSEDSESMRRKSRTTTPCSKVT